jgi:hypothetical protein
MSLPYNIPKSFPDQFDEFTKRLAAVGIILTPILGLGVWGFLAEKGCEKVKVFWDTRDDLLEVSRPLQAGLGWELDSVHPLTSKTKEQVLTFVQGLLIKKLSQDCG